MLTSKSYNSDETDTYGVVSIQGPKSRQLLSSFMAGEQHMKNIISNKNFPFGTSKKVNLRMSSNDLAEIELDALILRMTFVGELGYELYVPTNNCLQLVTNLLDNNQGIRVKIMVYILYFCGHRSTTQCCNKKSKFNCYILPHCFR